MRSDLPVNSKIVLPSNLMDLLSDFKVPEIIFIRQNFP